MAYFDANATTPLCPAAAAAFADAQQNSWYNPSSPYPVGAAVHNRLEDARTYLAKRIGCDPAQIVFNSGASEGAHSLFQYLATVLDPQASVAISAIEHPCVRESAHYFFPKRVIEIPVSKAGVADLQAVENIASGKALGGREAIGSRPGLIALMAANNETGALQPWQAALAIAHAHGIPFYTDAAQWLGKESAAGLGQADFVTGCAHKFGGPKGVGFVKIGGDFTGFHAQKGGAQENGHRAGTENYPAVAAMVAALEAREATLGTQRQSWVKAREVFEAELLQSIPGLVVNAAHAPRLANTSSLLLPRHRNTRWVARLAKRGFYLSTGSACATGKAGPSHVLDAMGLSPEQAERTVRVSALWEETTAADWQQLATAFTEVWHELNAEGSGGTSLASIISL